MTAVDEIGLEGRLQSCSSVVRSRVCSRQLTRTRGHHPKLVLLVTLSVSEALAAWHRLDWHYCCSVAASMQFDARHGKQSTEAHGGSAQHFQ